MAADIRAAVGRLENPAQRLSDRLFWFHMRPESLNADSPTVSDQPEESGRNHDQALHGLFAALSTDLDDAGAALWVQAIRAWHQVVSNDDYWSLSLALEEQGAFEPPVLLSEMDALRDGAVGLAAEPLLVAAREALAHDDTLTVRRILAALAELVDTGPWAVIAQLDIVSPALERFRALCRSVREESGSKILREQNVGDRNKSPCDAALKRFRGEVEPALKNMIQLVPPNHEVAQQAREEAAICLSGIATDYTWADDFIASEKLHEEALRLAHDTLGAIRIEDGLAQIRGAARKQRVFGAPISSAPSLGTINGFGFTLYGDSDRDTETRSYSTTHYFVALFVPIFPIGRYRVIAVGGNRYQFLGKLPLRKADRWHLGISTAAIVALVLGGMISSSQSPNSSYAPSTTSNSGTSSALTTSVRSQLADLKTQIDSGRSRMAMLKTQLQPAIQELNKLNAQMDTLKGELQSLDEQQKAGVQIDIEDYNSKVKAHNALLSRHRALTAANSSDFQTYHDLEKQDSVLVDQYNALLK